MPSDISYKPEVTNRSGTIDGSLHDCAVEIARWAMPIVSVYSMREAFFRDARAQYGDVAYWSNFADWKTQLTTLNASSFYVYFNFNTKDGPVEIDLPAAAGAGLSGSLLNAWQVPLIDVGEDGADEGRGSKYLITPPGYDDPIPDGYIHVPSENFNGYALLRVTPMTSSHASMKTATALIKKIQLCPFENTRRYASTWHIDMAGRMFDGVVHFNEGFYDALSKMINEEPVLERDVTAMQKVNGLGITKGKTFSPDAATRDILNAAIKQVHVDLMIRAMTSIEPFWRETHWGLHATAGLTTEFSYLTTEGFYDTDGRALMSFLACGFPKRMGVSAFYVAAITDANGDTLQGENSYRLHIPSGVPVKQYWEVAAYDLQTASFIKNSPALAIDSGNLKVDKNTDGSVDVFFGPKPQEGKTSNWIFTEPGKLWFALFRFYGPNKAVFEKKWKMSDIVRVM